MPPTSHVARRAQGIDVAIVFTHHLPPGPEAVAQARRAIDRLGSRIGDYDVQDLRLLVSELVTNSLRHGDAAGAGPVQLAVEVSRGRARVEVRDEGCGFRPPAGRPRPRERSGWGLVLVDELADAWGVEPEGPTRVWFELRLRRRSARRQAAAGCQPGRSRSGRSASTGTV